MFGLSAPVGFAVVILVNMLLLGWFQRAARVSPARLKGDRHVIRYSGALRSSVVAYAILLVIVLISGFLVVSRMEGPYPATPESIFILLAIITCPLLAALLVHVFSARIEYDSSHVYTFSPWGADRAVLWSDIVGYSFGRISKHHILTTKGGDEIRFSILLSGYQSLLEDARARGIPGFQ